MYKKCDFCKIKKFKVEYSKGHYICPSCEEIIDNYNRSINNCFNNYRYTRENLEKEKHRKDIINELRNIHSNKIILNEFKTDHSFQNEFMEYYIRLAGIESVSSFEDIEVLEQKINYIIQEEPLASKKISKELINSYFTELKIELRNIHFNKKIKNKEDIINYDIENFFIERYKLELKKHGFMVGNCGSGKTCAVKKEIENILKYTNNSVIVIDNDGLYKEFCEKHNGEYIDSIDNVSDIFSNRISIFNIQRGSKETKLKYAKLVLENIKKIDMNSSEKIWIYIDEYIEVIDEEFINLLMKCSVGNGIITVITTRLDDIMEKFYTDKSVRILLENSYIRMFRQFNRKDTAKFFGIELDVLEIDDIKTSVVILEDKLIRITEDNIENQKIEIEKQTIEIGDLKAMTDSENFLLIGETGSLAYPLFRYLMWLEDKNILWVDKESEKIFFELHKDKKKNPSVDFKLVEQFNNVSDFKNYSRIYLNSAIDNIETVHAAKISIKNKPTTVRFKNPEYGLLLKENYDTILIFNPNSENGKKKIIKSFQEHNIYLEKEVESFNEINEAIILWRDVISKDIRINFIRIDMEFEPEFPLNVTN